MIYKKPVELNDLIAYANIRPSEGEAVIKGQSLSKIFRANFWLKDFGKAWRVSLDIEVENEVPRLLKVTTYGRGGIPLSILEKFGGRGKLTAKEQTILDSPELQDEQEPVKAKHLTLVSRHSYELLTKAVVMSIRQWESIKRFNETQNWSHIGNVYTGKELQALEKELAKTTKRNVPTDSMLKDVAKRYKKAEKAGDPLYDDIMRHYSISERRARELITMCRRHKEKLLPKKKAGRPSVDQTQTSKKGK